MTVFCHMGTMKFQAVVIILLVNVGYLYAEEFVRVCYFPSTAGNRNNIARFDLQHIDPNLCTHLIYAYGMLDSKDKRIKALAPIAEEGESGKFSEFNNLKREVSSLKTLISIRGQTDKKDEFHSISKKDSDLKSFSKEAVKFLRQKHFDGLDIDWQYRPSFSPPGDDSSDSSDESSDSSDESSDSKERKVNSSVTMKLEFVKLLRALREQFDTDNADPKLILTFKGPGGRADVDGGFDVPQIAKYVDYALLMTYGFSKPGEKIASFNSPLYSASHDQANPYLSVDYSVRYWNKAGMPFNKIVVGISGVGRRQVLKDDNNRDPGAAVTGEIRSGTYYNIQEGLAFPEVCELFSDKSTKTYFDDNQKNSYLVHEDEWIGYESKKSLEIKVDWMRNLGLAGVMFSSLDEDDFTGEMCGDGKYPLLNAIKSSTTKTPVSKSEATTTINFITKKSIKSNTVTKALSGIFVLIMSTMFMN